MIQTRNSATANIAARHSFHKIQHAWQAANTQLNERNDCNATNIVLNSKRQAHFNPASLRIQFKIYSMLQTRNPANKTQEHAISHSIQNR